MKFNSSTTVHYRRGQYPCDQIRRAGTHRPVTRRAAPYDQSCAAYKRSLPPKEICLCLLAHSALQEVHQYRHFSYFGQKTGATGNEDYWDIGKA